MTMNTRPKMAGLLAALALIAAPMISQAQEMKWVNKGSFPPNNEPLMGAEGRVGTINGNGLHGVAVDPEGKVWLQPHNGAPDTVVVAGVKRGTISLFVYNADGTPADFSPVRFISGPNFADTLGGFINAAGNWEIRTGRGMTKDIDGNILVSQGNVIYKIDYTNGEGIAKLVAGPNSIGAVGVDDFNNVYVSDVVPGDPIRVYDADFNVVGNAIETSVGFTRGFDVSSDGNSIYWAGFDLNAVYRYTREDEFSPYNQVPDTLFKGFRAETVYRQKDNGYIWVSTGGGGSHAPNQAYGTSHAPYQWIAYDPATDTYMFSNPIEWDATNDDVIGLYSLDFTDDGQTAYGIAFENGVAPFAQVFKLEMTNSLDSDVTEIPEGYALAQNYPNPFNPSTSIKFEIAQNTNVTLTVYDMLGRVVATPINNMRLSAGSHTYNFDAGNLSSGIYLYEMRTASGVRLTNKMTLVK